MAHQSPRRLLIPAVLALSASLTLIYGQLSKPVFATNTSGATGALTVATEQDFVNVNTTSGAPNTSQPLTLTAVAGTPIYFYVNDFGTHSLSAFNLIITGGTGQSISQLNSCPTGSTFISPTNCTNGFFAKGVISPTMTTPMRIIGTVAGGTGTEWAVVFGRSGSVTINVNNSSADIVGKTSIS